MTKNLNVSPYFDDFNEQNKYYRILFKPGYPVQTRELTQLQSILQNQIEKFGNHIFQDGTVVLNGQRFFENSLLSIKLTETNDVSAAKDGIIIGATSGTKALVKATSNYIDVSNPGTFIVKVIEGSEFTAGETLTLSGTTTSYTVSSSTPFNTAMIFSINEGVFYIDGKFVLNSAQSVIVDKYSNTSSKSIGFVVSEKFLTSDTDEALLDNAQGTPNFAAPGADRYFIDLVLTVKDVNATVDSFVEIARVVSGQLVVNKDVTLYSELEKEFARRTYDESGDYTVKNFPITLRDHITTARATANIVSGAITAYTINDAGSGYTAAPIVTITGNGTGATATAIIDTNPASPTYQQITAITPVTNGSGYTTATVTISGDPNQFTITLDPGKAYVRGFELETINQTNISADRARTKETVSGIDTAVPYGNFLYVNSVLNAFNTTTFDTVELHNVARASVSGATSQIGTANVRFLKWVSGTVGTSGAIYKMSLFNITMTGGNLFKDVESIIIRSGSTVISGANIDLLSKVGGSAGGDVLLSGADTPTLVFPLNNTYIASIRDASNNVSTDYTTQRTFTNVSFSGGTASIATNNGFERFVGGAGAYSDSTKDQYYHVVVTAVGTSSFAVGDVLRFNSGASRSITGGTIVPNATHQVTFNVNASVSFTATIVAGINENAIQEKVKTLSGYTYKIISSPSTTAGGKNSIVTSDVYDILAVYNTGTTDPTGQISVDATTGAVTWGTVPTHTNTTVNYTLDNGQRDEVYDHGNIVLSGTAPTGTDHLVVVFRYFSHTGNGYFSVNSYSIDYAKIPVFTSPSTGREYKLRDCFDFRPRRQDNASTYQNAQLPDPDFSVNADYSYYLPRIDAVLATKDKTIINKQGISSLVPQVPVDESNSMRLYILSIPPYTSDLTEVEVKYVENKRYTMRDIGKLERRIENLEYYTQLSLLEKQAQDEKITDSSNLEKFKNGFIVDPFVGHSVGDTSNSDYRCSVDPTRRELRPFYEVYPLEFSFNNPTGTTVSSEGATLSYTETAFVTQSLATKSININPFNVIAYFGTITLDPSQDIWMDTIQLPPLHKVIDINQTAPDVFRGVTWGWGWNWAQPWAWNNWGWAGWGWGFNNWGWWGGWNGWWWGAPATTTTTQRTITESTQSLGNTVVDIQFLPYIRAKNVIGVAEGFKPKTKLYPFIDDTNVSQYTKPLTLVTINNITGGIFNDQTGENEDLTFRTGSTSGSIVATGSTAIISPATTADPTKRLLSVYNVTGTVAVGQYVVGSSGAYATVTAVTTYNLSDALYPDEFGLLGFEIDIPGQTFRTGERTVRLIDNIDNDTATTESSGEAKYFALGQVQTKQETLLTTRTITTRRVVTRRWVDPLAQSFMVDSTAYPAGLQVTSIDIFFRTKSTNIPVTLELRKMVNGLPESVQSIPFASVTLYPEDVQISEDATLATNFKFPVPIHLSPDEYCFVLLANSQEYEVFVAEMGKTLLNTNIKVTQQPYTGVLFKSQNASTWTPEQLEDMKFKINRASFASTGTVELVVNDVTPVGITANTTASSATISNISSLTGIAKDMLVVGTGIPAGTTISSINVASNTATLSANTTATGTAVSLKLYPVYQFSGITMNSSVITPSNTDIVWEIKALNRDTGLMDSSYSSIQNTTQFEFPAIKHVVPATQNSNTGSVVVRATLTSSNEAVSPMIDNGRTGAVVTKSVINNDSTGENAAAGGNAYARYITTQVTLADGFDASNIVVTLDAYKPAATNIKVYYKTLPVEKNTRLADESWVEMSLESSVAYSSSEVDYKEHRFFPPSSFNAYGVPVNNPISPRFNNFAIKIVLLSSNEAIVPKVRDFRAIALDS